MADIFLSYKKEDRAIAERLVGALRAAGRSVWWDDALNPNQAWDSMIEREIAAASHVVVLWTPRSVQSDWVRSEAHYAQDHNKLVPVMIERCDLPIAFMLRQAIDLSSGKFDKSNPQWTKLLSLFDRPPSTDGEAEAATAAAVPIKTLSGDHWLGPSKRPSWLVGAGAIGLLVLAGVLFLFRADLGFAKPPQPDVVVDPFTAHAAGLPAGFADSMSNEMFNGFSTSSRINPVNGDGKRRPHAYQLTGDISSEGDKLVVIAKLFAPDIEAPISTIKFDQPKSNPIAARLFGLYLADFTRCVATASDSTGSKLVILPSEAIAPWSRFCQLISVGTQTTSAETIVATLRNVLSAAPDFANGWSNLSENLLFSAFTPGANKAALLKESAAAADRALALDPTTAKAYQVKAWLAIGLVGDPNGTSALPRFHNFAEWEQLAQKSISVRPSDCGCELPNYAFTLAALGRTTASVPMLEQAVSNDPNNVGHAIALAVSRAATGNVIGARKMLDDLDAKWPGTKSIAGSRFPLALWNHDWAAARKALADQPDSAAKLAWPALLDALQSGDAGRIHAAGAPFVGLTSDATAINPSILNALALSGYDDQAVDAWTRGMDKGGSLHAAIFRPTFAQARKTAAFAALAQRMGLMDYWRIAGHRPDFCNEPSPAALCATVAKS